VERTLAAHRHRHACDVVENPQVCTTVDVILALCDLVWSAVDSAHPTFCWSAGRIGQMPHERRALSNAAVLCFSIVEPAVRRSSWPTYWLHHNP
jgi:hypothetical protein